jgi:uncharacterized protein (TIGR03067 family)
MCRTWHCAVVVALVLFTSSATADEATDEVKRLAGTWQGTGGAWRGQALTPEQARKCVLLVRSPRPSTDLSGGQRGLDLTVPDKVVGFDAGSTTDKKVTRYVTGWKEYGYTLDPSSNPPVLTAFKIIGIKGHGFAGIYRIKGDSLTICINFDRFGPLPKEFKSLKGSETLLLTFKRSK